jgi:aminopeptidase N
MRRCSSSSSAISSPLSADARRCRARARPDAPSAALAAILADPALDDLMRGELVMLPGEAYLAEQLNRSIRAASMPSARRSRHGWARAGERMDRPARSHAAVPYGLDAAARGARKLKTQALVYLAAADPAEAVARASAQYAAADNMTDRQGALMVLCGLDGAAARGRAGRFPRPLCRQPLVIDKWFSLQAGSLHPARSSMSRLWRSIPISR